MQFTERLVDDQGLHQLVHPNGVKVKLNFSASEVKGRKDDGCCVGSFRTRQPENLPLCARLIQCDVTRLEPVRSTWQTQFSARLFL